VVLSHGEVEKTALKFPVYSLRTGILAQLTFLIIAAMLLINVVMVKFAERDLTQEKLHTGRLLVRAVEQNLGPSWPARTRSSQKRTWTLSSEKGSAGCWRNQASQIS